MSKWYNWNAKVNFTAEQTRSRGYRLNLSQPRSKGSRLLVPWNNKSTRPATSCFHLFLGVWKALMKQSHSFLTYYMKWIIFSLFALPRIVSGRGFFPPCSRTNHNSQRPDVMKGCTLRMCSEYGLLAVLTVCTSAFLKPFSELQFGTVLKAHFSHFFSWISKHFLGAWNRL